MEQERGMKDLEGCGGGGNVSDRTYSVIGVVLSM
jgi:hypothetical protein